MPRGSGVGEGPGMRLLIVEDDPKLASALARGLRGEGYAVDVAGTGEEALFQARVYDYDAVILDVMLPGPDGIAVCRTLREEALGAGADADRPRRRRRPHPGARLGGRRLPGQALRLR